MKGKKKETETEFPQYSACNKCFAERLADKPQSGDNYIVAASDESPQMNRSAIPFSICLWLSAPKTDLKITSQHFGNDAAGFLEKGSSEALQRTFSPLDLIDSIKAR